MLNLAGLWACMHEASNDGWHLLLQRSPSTWQACQASSCCAHSLLEQDYIMARTDRVSPAACEGTWHGGGTCITWPTVRRGTLLSPRADIRQFSHGIPSLLRSGYDSYSRPCLGSDQLLTSHLTAASIAVCIKPQNAQSKCYIHAVMQQPMSVKPGPSVAVCQLWRHL